MGATPPVNTETMQSSAAAQLAPVKLSMLVAGEGGAGTWSDGKLTTKVGRNSDPVRRVLHTLYTFGAPQVASRCNHTWGARKVHHAACMRTCADMLMQCLTTN